MRTTNTTVSLPKFFLTIIYSFVVLNVVTYDIFVSNLSMMRKYFGVSEFIMSISMVMGPLLAALSGLVYGFLSDTRGRKPIMNSSLALVFMGGIISAMADHIESFMIGRVLQALGAGGLLNIAIAMLGDVMTGARYAKSIATVSLLFPITYAVCPYFGAYLAKTLGWESNFLFMTLLSAIFFLVFKFYMPETLQRSQSALPIRSLVPKILSYLKPNHFMSLSLLHSFTLMMPIMYVTNNAYLFVENYGVSNSMFALLQLIPITTCIISTSIYKAIVEKIGYEKAYQIGIFSMMVFLALNLLSLVFSYSNLWSILLINSQFFIGMPFITTTAATQAFDSTIDDRGFAVAFVSMMRNFCMAFGVFVVTYFYNKTAVPLHILSVCSAALIVSLYFYEKNHYTD